MNLKYDYWTGPINEVERSLISSIAQYIRHYNNVKIGRTNNPSRRFDDHGRSSIGWNIMVVKYKTTSANYINRLEKLLIDRYRPYLLNEIGGGGGPLGDGPYYLYVLLK